LIVHERGLLTVKELSTYLRVSPCAVYRLVEKHEIPFIRRPGMGLRFQREAVEEWLEKHTLGPYKKHSQLIDNKRNILTSASLPPIIFVGGDNGGREMATAKSKSRFNVGFGAIYQRKRKNGSVRWYLDYWDAKGKRIQRVAAHASSREEALVALKSAVLDVHYRECGIPSPPQKLSFSDFSRMYLENYAKVNKRSWKDDSYRLEARMKPYFGSYQLEEITPLMVEKYRAQRLKEGVTRSTVNRETTILKKMFNLAIDWNLAAQNPVLKVKLFSEKDTQKERILTCEEEVALLAESPAFLRPILEVALNTGMRRGEILNLTWEQVDLSKKLIVVRQTKSGKDRAIPINDSLYGILRALKALDGRQELVFPNPMTGKPYTEVKKSFKLACKRAGIAGLRFHDLRHTFASRLIEAGADIVTVRDLLGHFSVKMTQRYTHPGRSQRVDAVGLLDRKRAQNGGNLLHPCYTN
jgi:excisionase family DNA binding protein